MQINKIIKSNKSIKVNIMFDDGQTKRSPEELYNYYKEYHIIIHDLYLSSDYNGDVILKDYYDWSQIVNGNSNENEFSSSLKRERILKSIRNKMIKSIGIKESQNKMI